MRIFLDTNILIDLLEARGEFTQNALKVASMVVNNGDELLQLINHLIKARLRC